MTHRPRTARPVSLALALTGCLSLAACGAKGSAAQGNAAQGNGAAGSAKPAAVKVRAGDSSCELSQTTLTAGTATFDITNTGSRTTEVYLYASGDRIVAEKENIGPGLRYTLTAEVPAGSYVVACKPGQTGSGIRTPVTAAAAAGAPAADPAGVRAVAAYRSYVQSQVDALVPLVAGLTDAVKAGDLAKAQQLYAPSRVPWESIEPVAESFGDLDPRLDLREADLTPGQQWTGWHRLEKALWVDHSTAGLAPVADQLVADVADLRGRVAGAQLSVASIGNGAKELLDEVATTKVTGEEETFSHTDLVDFAANVAGAHQAFEVLRPLVTRSDGSLAASLDTAFGNVDAALATYARGSGYVSYDTVDEAGRRELSRVVDALGAPLSQLAATATR